MLSLEALGFLHFQGAGNAKSSLALWVFPEGATVVLRDLGRPLIPTVRWSAQLPGTINFKKGSLCTVE